MRTRRQTRASEMTEIKEEPLPTDEGALGPRLDEEKVPKKPESEGEAPNDVDDEPAPFSMLSDDVAAFLKIEPIGDEPEGRLQQILQILAEQEKKLKEDCSLKLRSENENAEKLKKKLIKLIDALPAEFLDGPSNDIAFSQMRMPALLNMPSYSVGRSSSSQVRVVRVFNKDTDADQMLEEWSAKYDELNKLLFKEKEATDEA